METHLRREDGLYWVDYGTTGPIGQERPNDIREASSVVSLGLNMAMGVLHAELFKMTADELYRIRAIRTADALSNCLLSLGGVFLNDRDAWSQGTFAGDWVREVLSLPGISAKSWTLLRMTADSICANARTTNGYYGGSWSGPAEGLLSRWWSVGSKPEQIMTSASTVNMIVAAAYSAPQLHGLLRPTLQLMRRSVDGTFQITVVGEPSWSHDLETTTDFVDWTTVTNIFPNQEGKSFIYTFPGCNPLTYYRASLMLR
jgi:hypothetical protein